MSPSEAILVVSVLAASIAGCRERCTYEMQVGPWGRQKAIYRLNTSTGEICAYRPFEGGGTNALLLLACVEGSPPPWSQLLNRGTEDDE